MCDSMKGISQHLLLSTALNTFLLLYYYTLMYTHAVNLICNIVRPVYLSAIAFVEDSICDILHVGNKKTNVHKGTSFVCNSQLLIRN